MERIQVKKKTPWIAWETIGKPKEERGLGLINLKQRNVTTAVKRGLEWKMGKIKWAALCNVKYRTLNKDGDHKAPHNVSPLGKKIT